MNNSLTSDERLWGMLSHLGTLSAHFIPFGNIIIPLVIWLVKRDESEFINYHGREALNFQISLMIYAAITVVLAFMLVGFLLMIPLWIFGIVMVIVAGLKANEGHYYRYPFTIRILK